MLSTRLLYIIAVVVAGTVGSLLVMQLWGARSLVWTTPATASLQTKLGWNTLSGRPPLLVGHRGEKAFMPEHSRASYWQAALEGADYIEPDLALTRDGHLVVNHNEWLGENTNVADIPSLSHLRTNKTWLDNGRSISVTNEWFIKDMTLAQIKQLRIRQDPEFAWRPQHFNDMFSVLTFEEYLQLVRNLTIDVGRPFGVIPELKSPKFYNDGRSYPRYFEDRAILTLSHYEWANVSVEVNRSAHADLKLQPLRALPGGVTLGPAAWQSFDLDTAEYLSAHTSNVPVVALVETLPWAFTPGGLDKLSKFAAIVSPWKDFFVAGAENVLRSINVTWDSEEIESLGGFIPPYKFAAEAHSRNLSISPYTFYDSHQPMAYLCQKDASLGAFCPTDKQAEFFYFFSLGVDYMFVENIVEARLLQEKYANRVGD
ncbi:hypothetical protein J3B01_001787 [Coemansia erecta]|nr:hypothetical protein J3B01_001787 [Coemansia erecta]